MKALSIRSDFAFDILVGRKTIECRAWKCDFRGTIMICSTAEKISGTIPGHALCTADLVDIVPFEPIHLKDACMTEMPTGKKQFYAWKLDNIQMIWPVPVKGKLSLWQFDKPFEYIPYELTPELQHRFQTDCLGLIIS